MASKMFDLSRITVYKKKRKGKKPKRASGRLQQYADNLNKNLPNSERWFQNLWTKDMEQDKLDLYQDKFNYPLGRYIPDVINMGYRYVIEIDGSIHDDPMVQWKDKVKDLYYKKKGYQVFRLKAYDQDAYEELVINILLLRDHMSRRY